MRFTDQTSNNCAINLHYASRIIVDSKEEEKGAEAQIFGATKKTDENARKAARRRHYTDGAIKLRSCGVNSLSKSVY